MKKFFRKNWVRLLYITLLSFTLIFILKIDGKSKPFFNMSRYIALSGLGFSINGILYHFVLKLKEPRNIIDASRLYLSHGLKEKYKRKETEVFQDFEESKTNYNPVAFFWSDVRHKNIINTSIVEINDSTNKKTSRALRVEFNNNSDKGCNIAIRPQNGKAYDNSESKKYLKVEARIVQEKQEKIDSLSELGLAIRVVNGYMQHWEYAEHSKEYIHLPIKKNNRQWDKVFIDLSDKDKWKLFDGDGNQEKLDLKKNPDFDIIAFIILKFGKCSNSNGELKEAKGIIEIQSIKISNNKD